MNNRLVYLLVGVIMIVMIVLSACGSQSVASPSTSSPSTSTPQPSTSSAPSSPQSKTPTSTSVAPTATSTTSAQRGGILKIASRYDLNNIGGAGDFSGPEQITFLSAPTERLFRTDKNGKWIPELAESWETSADGLTTTFHLKKGVKFQDGTDFNAAAVKYQFDTLAKNNLYASNFVNMASTQVIDDYTVSVTLKTFDNDFFLNLSQSVQGQLCSPTAMQKKVAAEDIAKAHLVGTGPFQFVSWKRATNLIFQRSNVYYKPGLPNMDGVQWIEFADSTTAIMALKAGDIDIIDGVSTQDAAGLRASGFKIDMTDWGMQRILVPDSANPDSPFAKEPVREAVEYAIDRQAISKSLDENYTEACTQLSSSKDAVYDPTMMPPRKYDIAKAKKLLTSAGYPNGFQTTLYAQTNENRDLLVAIQGYLMEAGIKADIQLVDSSKMASLNKDGWHNGLLLYVQGNFASTVSMDRYFSQSAIRYASMIKSDEMQKLIDTAITEPDYDKRIAVQKQWQKYMYDNALTIPLYTFWMLQARNPIVHDLNWGIGFSTYYDWSTAWIGK
jgi:ABC-type transport system substrate-binding protein